MKRKIIGTWAICNTGAINVYDISNDYVYAGINSEAERAYEILWTIPLSDDEDSQAYILLGNEAYYLSECIKVYDVKEAS